MLKFSVHNHKLMALARWLGVYLTQVISFDLPAGWTCSKAGVCKTLAARDTGRITKIGHIACYAAKAEAYSPNSRRMRWHNFDSLVACKNNINKMFALLSESLPENIKVMRIHSSGDFFSKPYFLAWVKLAKANPDIIFFGYTKHLDYAIFELPDNMYLQYSFGSLDDERRAKLKYHVPTCYIGEYKKQYNGYKIVCNKENTNHEDFIAILKHRSFVITEH
jgi:hypothetical protein